MAADWQRNGNKWQQMAAGFWAPTGQWVQVGGPAIGETGIE
jgi:hypothetical protein